MALFNILKIHPNLVPAGILFAPVGPDQICFHLESVTSRGNGNNSGIIVHVDTALKSIPFPKNPDAPLATRVYRPLDVQDSRETHK